MLGYFQATPLLVRLSMSSIAALLAKGLLQPGQEIVYFRRSVDLQHKARVQTDGNIVTEDGKIHKSPSGAAKHFSGKPIDGWNAWKIAGTKVSLAELRAKISE
jgi:hypothetical protein